MQHNQNHVVPQSQSNQPPNHNESSSANHNLAQPQAFSYPPAAKPSQHAKARKATPTKAPASASRRSERERKSTLVYVDGHAVLRQNNYEVKGGEYVHGQAYSNEPPSSKRSRTGDQLDDPTACKKAKQKEPPRSRVVSAHEVQRKHHNARVQAVVRKNQGLGWKFLAQHIDLLQHFCEPKVLAELKTILDNNKSSRVDYHPLDLLTEAPKAVQATLRDYQLQGLTFMANMHNQNLSMILGDEMGLVSLMLFVFVSLIL